MVLLDTPGVLLSSGFIALPPPGEETPFSMSEEPSTASFNEDVVVLFGTGQTMTVPSLLADCLDGKEKERRRKGEKRRREEEEKRRRKGEKRRREGEKERRRRRRRKTTNK